jgi:hypothetical protein
MGKIVRRHPDWPERLAEYIEGRKSAPFVWAGHDCCAFACGGVIVQSGVDPMKKAMGHYRTPRGAAGWIVRNGGSLMTVAVRLGEACGMRKIPVAMAGRGCVVLGTVRMETDNGVIETPALGLVGMDSRFSLFAAKIGFEPYPTRSCLAAWGFD